jgi:hypothetical protein
MSSSVISTSNTNINYTFLQNALKSINRYTDEKAWARHFAREYFHEVSHKPGFLPIYNNLLKMLHDMPKPVVNKKNKSDEKTNNFDMNEFIKNALENIEDYNNEKEWARDYARQLFHKLERKISFANLYNTLMEEFNKAYDDEWANTNTNKKEKEEDEEWLPYQHKTSSNSSNTSSSNAVTDPSGNQLFVEDNNQTETERKQGKYILNKILYKEYNAWYDAFQAEEQDERIYEKNNGESNIQSGDQRWIYHASKILSRKTNIPTESISPIVEAWLLELNKNM